MNCSENTASFLSTCSTMHIFHNRIFLLNKFSGRLKIGLELRSPPLSLLETVGWLAQATVTFLVGTRPYEPLAGSQLACAGPACWLAHGALSQSLPPFPAAVTATDSALNLEFYSFLVSWAEGKKHRTCSISSRLCCVSLECI